MATHGRVLDRRRFELLMGAADADAALAAVDAYRNPDGGYGWGLEPDLRAPESQPGGALHALEVFAEVGTPTPRAVQVCDWLGTISTPDGGVPFALPVADPAGCAPFWLQADPDTAALQSTAFVTAVALRVARHDPAVAAHPWLRDAVAYCFRTIGAIRQRPFAIELCFAIQVLDAAHDTYPEAAALLDHIGQFVPADGLLPVDGGKEGETLRALDFSPLPDCPSRRLVTPEVVAAELTRLAGAQQPDGGWTVDFHSYSPAAELEWRGYRTVAALSTLRHNGVLP
ncbi:hypothetical protein [Kibdelosporangium phytohabitans]|uniref:Prenyltransferase n=1 Tax=Kibdelosporangium phytohabitans TaxID=860235 RepID=A0A0N9I7K5_9PSEU|nr:hypothetical protein [Kibdelosporangium phytohabitans]ALG14904.1 hypothetical protein AOZ06_19710 [Kibdelosporangium phytohabitans]